MRGTEVLVAAKVLNYERVVTSLLQFFIPNITEFYSSLLPFLCFTTNQFAHKLIFLANSIKYFVNVFIIY